MLSATEVVFQIIRADETLLIEVAESLEGLTQSFHQGRVIEDICRAKLLGEHNPCNELQHQMLEKVIANVFWPNLAGRLSQLIEQQPPKKKRRHEKKVSDRPSAMFSESGSLRDAPTVKITRPEAEKGTLGKDWSEPEEEKPTDKSAVIYL